LLTALAAASRVLCVSGTAREPRRAQTKAIATPAGELFLARRFAHHPSRSQCRCVVVCWLQLLRVRPQLRWTRVPVFAGCHVQGVSPVAAHSHGGLSSAQLVAACLMCICTTLRFWRAAVVCIIACHLTGFVCLCVCGNLQMGHAAVRCDFCTCLRS
jgi:hypothetical protein